MYHDPPLLARQILERSDAVIQLEFLQNTMADEKRRRQYGEFIERNAIEGNEYNAQC